MHPRRVAYPLRIEAPGEAYHVNGNAVDGCKLFVTMTIARAFCDSLPRNSSAANGRASHTRL